MELIASRQEWYALYVRRHYEWLACKALNHLQIESFLPTYRLQARRCSVVANLDKPLFPNYVFCKTDLQTGPKLYTVPGLLGIVGNGRIPIPVRSEEIDSLRLLVASNVAVSPCGYMHPGDEVHINRGPLKGLRRTYIETRETGHLIVSLPLLQRSIRVRLEAHWIEFSGGVASRQSMPIAG